MFISNSSFRAVSLLLPLTLALAGVSSAFPITASVQRVDVDPANFPIGDVFGAAIGGTGRFIAFASFSGLFSGSDTNGREDVYVWDRDDASFSLASISTGGTQSDKHCTDPAISADGRFVAFISASSALVPDANPTETPSLFVRDRPGATTRLVAVLGREAAFSADGGILAYAQPTDGSPTQVYAYSTATGDRELISCSTSGTPGSLSSGLPFVSENGRYVAFVSDASNLVAGDSNSSTDVFIRDRMLGTTERASLGNGGVQANTHCIRPSISADARFVAFESAASNLVAGDTNGTSDIFVRDRLNGTTQRVSVSTGGAQGHGFFPRLSADGNRVAFISQASNLALGDSAAQADVFLHLVQEGTTVKVTGAFDGGELNNGTLGFDMDRTGHRFAVNTYADNLIENMPGGPGLYALQVDEAPTPPKGGKLKIPATVNFGRLQVGSNGQQTITLRNQGSQAVTGRIFLPPTPFGVSADGYYVLKPHATLAVPVSFHPQEARKFASRLRLTSGTKQVHVQLKGVARP